MSSFVWVFLGEAARFPSAVYPDYDSAVSWIAEQQLTGVLTKYPVGVPVYDWAIKNGLFEPKEDRHRSASFIGKFSCAGMDHVHFEQGVSS